LGTAINPVASEVTRGKNATRKVTMTRGPSPAPIETTRIGASATLGIDWVKTSSGYNVFAITADEAIIIAKGKLITIDNKKPPRIVLTVAIV
jgi:hypothetical protein